jgi:sec-independent protein translocase protein TatA
MPFGDIHPLFLIGILAIVLIIFGPGKLPQLGGALGRGIREFRNSTKEVQDSISGDDTTTKSVETTTQK